MHQRIDSETLEAFLLGDLSGAERAGVEAQLAADPTLGSEALLQKDIISGLQESRRLELKTRLQNTPTPPLGFWTQTRVAASLLLGALLIGGAVLYFARGEGEAEQEAVKEEVETTGQFTAELSDEKSTSASESTDEATNTVADPQTSNERLSYATEPARTDEEVAFAPELVERPVFPGIEGENPNPVGEKQSIEVPRGEEMGAGAPTVRLIRPVIQEKKGKFHYRFDGERLNLIGEFEKTTYTLYELSYAKGQMFLSYKGKYYEIIDTGGEVVPLQQVTNQTVIKSLPNN